MDPGEEWEELESWEPVTAEKEEWIRLIHHLEGLTLLSNAIGQGDMRKLPPAPWTTFPQSLEGNSEGEEDISPGEREERRLNVGSLQIMLLGDGEPTCISTAVLHLTHVHNIYATSFHASRMFYSVLKGGVTAAALEEYGPGLIAHCIAKWFIDNKIPAEFIAQLPSDPHDLPDGSK